MYVCGDDRTVARVRAPSGSTENYDGVCIDFGDALNHIMYGMPKVRYASGDIAVDERLVLCGHNELLVQTAAILSMPVTSLIGRKQVELLPDPIPDNSNR